MPLDECLKIAVRQPPSAVGFTHASSVMPVARSSEGLSGTVTQLLEPSNVSAPPNRPIGAQPVAVAVPWLPNPEASATVAPAPSLKAYAATWPGAAALAAGRMSDTAAHRTAPRRTVRIRFTAPCGLLDDRPGRELATSTPVRQDASDARYSRAGGAHFDGRTEPCDGSRRRSRWSWRARRGAPGRPQPPRSATTPGKAPISPGAPPA